MWGCMQLLGDASAATNVIKGHVTPLIQTLSAFGAVAAAGSLVVGGYHYVTASGDPDKLQTAKTIIKRALMGLTIVLAALTVTTVLTNAYTTPAGGTENVLPSPDLPTQIPKNGLGEAIVEGITEAAGNIILGLAKPVITALEFFTKATPYVAKNSNVFQLWLVTLAIGNGLFVLVVALIGFHVMSSTVLGFDEMDIRQLLPRLALAFAAMNTSIFLIDVLIGLSNGLIDALRAGFPVPSVWENLRLAASNTGGLGLGVLLIMVAFVVLSVMLLIYYVGRLVTIYLGAILSPLVALLWLLPAFRDLANTLVKTYLATIFIIFVHIAILQLASSFFAGMVVASPGADPNPLMSMAVGIASLIALLKAEGVMRQYVAASTTPRAMRKIQRQISSSTKTFVHGAKKAASSKVAQAAGKKTKQVAVKGAQATGRVAKDAAVKGATAAVIATSSPAVRRADQLQPAVAVVRSIPPPPETMRKENRKDV